jgi:hypothetical protein
MLGSQSSTVDSSLLLVLGGLCLAMISVALVRWVRERRVTSRDLTREQRARLREQQEVRRSMEELLTQLEEVSDRINAQTDAQFARLAELIAAADQRIAQLEPPGDRPRAAAHPKGQPAPVASSFLSEAPPRTAELAVPPGAPPLRSATARASATPAPGASRSERFRRIYELADSGSTPIAIADALSLPLGEVELILTLRKYRAAAAHAARE